MGILRVEGISKSFGGVRAVRDVSFSMEQGEIVGLIGPNGAGKTTMFGLISGFHKPDEGQVFFEGENIVGCRPHEICTKGLTRTFQIVKPFSGMTTLENVMVGGFCRNPHSDDCLRRSEDVLTLLGLQEKRNVLSEKLTLPDRKCLELARALATEPRLILLDEIMAGLVQTEWNKVLETILSIRERGITILVIEHVMKAVMQISDRIVVISEGAKICEGTPSVVANNEKVIVAYLGDDNDSL